MKKLPFIFGFVLFLLLSFNASAQSGNFFAGKWEVLVEGTPQGDAKMVLEIVEKDGVFSGSIIDPATKKEISKLTKIEIKPKTIAVYFNSQGYDVYLYLEKEDQDKASGSMMDMFDATAMRIKA
ncbi:hypothetical protein RCH33_954 [Flavobacterium daejeonense]|nr:hypothetical protein RCH33_954 [Flavobacterium daejeonense]